MFLKWPYFHLNLLHEGFPSIFPMVPVHSWRIHTWKIQPIEIGVATVFVPPSTFPYHRAVLVTVSVIISVVGREHHSVEITEWITSIALKYSEKAQKLWILSVLITFLLRDSCLHFFALVKRGVPIGKLGGGGIWKLEVSKSSEISSLSLFR